MTEKRDLHMHSTASDGIYTPTELVRMRKKEGYTCIAITDHDGTDGVEEAQEAGRREGITVLTGIEIGTVVRDRNELHILGYEFDIHNETLRRELADMRRIRIERNQALLRFFQAKGYRITMEDLLQHPDQDYIGKPNFARALVAKGYAGSVAEVFASREMLGSPEASGLKKKKVITRDAIGWIRGAGGWASLAHPMKIRGIGARDSEEFWETLADILAELKKDGLAGLEVRHPSARPEDTRRLLALAGKYDLIPTEGSDFHGDR